MHQSICVSQIIQEPIPKALPHMRPGNQPGYIEQLDRYTSPSVYTRAIVWFAA
jgi:hypothetical protein